jgi:bifunctional non-homologous end joining protein LigD
MEIKPMLLQEIRIDSLAFDEYRNWFWQEKANGIRVIVHIKDGRISAVRNRRNYPCLHLYPELKELDFGKVNAILDCELCVFDKQHKSMFYGGINQRDKKLYEANVKKYPVTLVAFDLLYLNGVILFGHPYKERLRLLTENFKDTVNFEVVANIKNPKEYWENVVIPEGREGLVIKNPEAIYELDSRSKNYLKFKSYNQVDVIITGLEANPKGAKIFGKAIIDEKPIDIEAQFGGIENLKVGDVVPVEYLFIEGNKLIQPHKVKLWKKKNGDS